MRSRLWVACGVLAALSLGACSTAPDLPAPAANSASAVVLDEQFDPIAVLESGTGASVVETDAPSRLTVARALAESADLWSSATESSATVVVKKAYFEFAPGDERASGRQRLVYVIGIRPLWLDSSPKAPSGYIEEVLVVDADTGGLVEAWQQAAGER